MRIKLKKDIIIPAGTILDHAPRMTERFGDNHFNCTVGLTNNECGTFELYVDPADTELFELVERIKS